VKSKRTDWKRRFIGLRKIHCKSLHRLRVLRCDVVAEEMRREKATAYAAKLANAWCDLRGSTRPIVQAVERLLRSFGSSNAPEVLALSAALDRYPDSKRRALAGRED